MLFGDPNDPEELDIDPLIDTDETNELIEEFGLESTQLAYYYLHRYKLHKTQIQDIIELDDTDVLAFLIIEEEQSLREAQESANLRSQTERLK